MQPVGVRVCRQAGALYPEGLAAWTLGSSSSSGSPPAAGDALVWEGVVKRKSLLLPLMLIPR